MEIWTDHERNFLELDETNMEFKVEFDETDDYLLFDGTRVEFGGDFFEFDGIEV